ncbi:hypothetical protein DL764_009663 [Monosporascus ibericus]|uniref:Uncharacterized protein n=1 Tax=Monosporascus ibericus TaxID=155417 RepID=A0A4Q4SXH0_9PEZI|nr:hypothetical protein DL764_009663 [Monosporascus ibericus]
MSVIGATTKAAANRSHDKALFSDVVVKCGRRAGGCTATSCRDLDLWELCRQPSMATRLMDIFDLGDFFAIPKLCQEDTGHFSKYLAEELVQIQREYHLYDSHKLGAHIQTIKAVYGRDTPAQERFLPVLTEFIHRARYRLLREPEFTTLLDEIPALAVKMFRTRVDSGYMHPRDSTQDQIKGVLQEVCREKALTPPTTDWMGRFQAYREKKKDYKKSLETQSDELMEVPSEA